MLEYIVFLGLLLIILGSVLYQSSIIDSFRQRNRRRWYGQHYGYRYRPPRRVSWIPPPRRLAWIPSPFLNLVSTINCPTGCSNLGRGRWGCTYPGYDINSCRFATDCRFCGI